MANTIVVLSYENVMETYNPEKNITTPNITKFELAKVFGQRMEQLARGAPSMINAASVDMSGLVNHEKFKKITELELKTRVLPFMIARTLPNGEKEFWRLCDMTVPGF